MVRDRQADRQILGEGERRGGGGARGDGWRETDRDKERE